MTYAPKQFDIPAIEGISEKTMALHMKLYEGYVKHVNLILEKTEEYVKDSEKHAYVLGELQRQFAFEFDGMRNHEYYFGALVGGPKELPAGSALMKAIEGEWSDFQKFSERMRAVALTRGIGWAMLTYDASADRLLTNFVNEQHLGHLTDVCPILPIDVWEHAFILDYAPADKGKYIDAYLKNVNWETVAGLFDEARKK